MNIIKLRILKLIQKISYLNYNYYILNESIISDYKYDKLFEELKYLEKKYKKFNFFFSPTKNIFYNYNFKDNKKIKHLSPLLSLKNTYNLKNIIKFDKKNKKLLNLNNIEYFCEGKLDGISVNIIYKNNILKKIITRGNGVYGEDISNNIIYIKNIPTNIDYYNFKILNNNLNIIEIRGELCISKKNFEILNENLINEKKFSNPRSAVSGIMRSKKINSIYKNLITFFFHSVGYNYNKNIYKNLFYKKYDVLFKNIKKYNFKVCKYNKVCNNINKINLFYKYLYNKREKSNYMFDGIVIKINNVKFQKKISISNKYPNWSIAYKFKPKNKITKVLNVKYTLSKHGILTPILIFNEIKIFGIIIKKVSLYNINYMNKLNIMIGDYISIKLSSDTIPIIDKVILKNRNYNNLKKIYIPDKCLFCNNNLLNINNKIYCNSYFNCKQQIKYRINHFISKKTIYICDISKKNINFLVENEYIKNLLDIFNLNYKIFKILKKKKNDFIKYKNIIKNKININFETFIYSLNIIGLGEIQSYNISKKIKNIYFFLNICDKQFNKIDINKNILNNINIFLKNVDNVRIIKIIVKRYINIIYKN